MPDERYAKALEEFLAAVRQRVAAGDSLHEIVAGLPNQTLAIKQFKEAGFDLSHESQRAYLQAEAEFIRTALSCLARGESLRGLLAMLPNPRLAKRQLKKAGIG